MRGGAEPGPSERGPWALSPAGFQTSSLPFPPLWVYFIKKIEHLKKSSEMKRSQTHHLDGAILLHFYFFLEYFNINDKHSESSLLNTSAGTSKI